MANGGVRRVLSLGVAAMASFAAAAAPSFLAAKKVDSGPRRNAHHADRMDIYFGRWSYARKGKRTAAQIKRAARKKRNRARAK